jgi:sugar phosphate isomerase/epimerase
MAEPPADRVLALACLAFLDVEPEVHVAAAAAVGFDEVTLRVTGSADVGPAEIGHDARRLARLRAALNAAGVGVRDVEVVRMRPELHPDQVARTLEAAATLGARHLLVVNSDLDQAHATDTLGRIVEQAAGTGVTPCLEPMRFTRCRDVAEAVATAVPAGAAVLVDALHLFRSGDGPEAIAQAVRRHGRGLFPYVQLCDAPAQGPEGDDGLREEAVSCRLLPGQGELPLAGLLSVLPDGVPIAVEAPTLELRAAPPRERAAEAIRSVREVLARTGG